jgi:hypothetical protein
MRTTKAWRERVRRRDALYPDELPSYLLPPAPGPPVFDSSLQRAGEAIGRN